MVYQPHTMAAVPLHSMMRALFTLSALLLMMLSARGQFGLAAGSPQSAAELRADVKSIAPGSTFEVALELRHPAGWHSYYRNSGGIEQGVSVRWSLPDGFSAGPIQWPVPGVKDGYLGKSFVHEGSPVFLSKITAPATLATGQSVVITAGAEWQICKEKSCINEQRTLRLELPVTAVAEKDPAAAAWFDSARARLPAAATGWQFSARDDAGGVLLRAVPPTGAAATPVDFVPDQAFLKSAGDGGAITREGDAWLIRLPRAETDALGNAIAREDSFSGILTGPHPVAVPPTPIAAAATAAAHAIPGYLTVIGGMLLGGLILNLMPCVFPVIGLKIMGFVQQAGSSRARVAAHGMMFTLGVFVSFGVLSAILYSAKLGWGYQLQNPWVVLSLMLLMFILALNMYGVFEIGASATSIGGTLQAKQGLAGSFFSGVLATVVATPCSAPYLGAAIGAAISLPAWWFFAAFAAMALGLALPYLVLSVFPRLIGMLPRPGAWMESFKQAMSFLLFATAGYLLWVYGGIIDYENLPGPVFGLSCIAAACWIHGRWNLPHRPGRTRATAAACALILAAAGLFMAKPPKPSAVEWQPWSLESQSAALREGRPVYIDFTAKWCATCQVNKKRAYTPVVAEWMRRKRVLALKADKTRPDPAIEQALRGYGRTAIPVNVLLTPGGGQVIFPELLSPDDLIRELEKL